MSTVTLEPESLEAPAEEWGAEGPVVSVVVAVRRDDRGLERTLDALYAQTRAYFLEIVLVDGTEAGVRGGVRESLAGLHHLRVPEASLPVLKGRGILASKGRYVGFIDPHDCPEADWMEQVEAAFEDARVVAVGGTVLPGGSPGPGNRAAYLFEYGAFAPGFTEGPTAGDLPGNNVAYRRSALVETCAELLPEGFWKPFFHERIREQGGQLHLRPGMRIRHETEYDLLGFARSRFHFGRCFGAMRRARSRGLRRWTYCVFAPVVPGLLCVRHFRRARGQAALRALLPGTRGALVVVCFAWGLGEWWGTWFGRGRSCERVY
jgi:hypothetical protein